MQSYFVFKGVDSRQMGILTAAAAPIVRGEEAVEHVQIPGRAGELTLTEGADIYRGYIQTITISVKGAGHVRDVLRWLSGSGVVTFCSEPDRAQDARVIGAVTLSRASPNIDRYRGEVQFYCEPLKRKIFPDPITLEAADNVYNGGDVIARPRITMSCAAGANVTITSSSGTFTVDLSGTAHTGAIIDSGAEIVTTTNGQTNLMALCSGDFPTLARGAVAIGGTNWTQLVIHREERYL